MSWHITANEINQWSISRTREAQEILPKLIRKLILATVESKYIHFPSGDSILTGGWDGVLEVEKGNEFIPYGKSYWEFGTNKNINQKANNDYQKRTDKEANITDSFVFATTKTWSKKSDFESVKNKETKWKEVRGINSDDLETWLSLAPSVHLWFAKFIGKRPKSALDVEQVLYRWSSQTKIKLSPDLVLVSREKEKKKLVSTLSSVPSKIIIISQSEDESFIFAVSAVKDEEVFLSKTLVVFSQGEWDDLIESNNSLILIPQSFTPNNIGHAIEKGHYVIETGVSSSITDGSNIEIKLPKIRKSQKQEVLETMGVEKDKTWELLDDTKGFLHAIVKHPLLQPFDNKQKPDWINSYSTDILSTILFISSWNRENQYDIKILEKLSNLEYESFEKELHKLKTEKETPIRLVGNFWQVISKINLWELIANKISVSKINKLQAVTIDIFSEIDLKFEVNAQDRWMVWDKDLNHSGLIRESLADSLCLMSVLGESQFKSKISNFLESLYNQNLDVETWYSYGHQLLLLAEASPNSFLTAFEKALDKKDSSLEKLLESGDISMGGCYHCDLLWALERISWNTDYISRVILVLAKLFKLEVKSNLSNQPFNSLKDIFLGWVNYSSLTYNEKIEILEHILLKKEPEVAWKLLINILPNTHSTASEINTPKYNTWNEKLSKTVLKVDYYNYNDEVNRLILENVNADINKWKDIFNNIEKFNDTKYFVAIEQFRGLDKSIFSEKDKLQLSTVIRGKIHHHRKYGAGTWAMSIDEIDKLEEFFYFIEPEKLIYKYKYLFDEYFPNILNPNSSDDDFEKEERQCESQREEAIQIILKKENFSSLIELVEIVQYPNQVARLLVGLNIEDYNNDIFKLIKCDNIKLVSFAQEYIRQLYFKNQIEINDFLEQYDSVEKAKVLLTLPFESKIFETLKTQNEKVQEYYWQNNYEYFRVEDEDINYIEWVLTQFKNHKRPMRAIDCFSNVLYMKRKGLEIEINLDLIYELLIQIATEENGEDLKHYNILKTIKHFLKYSNDTEKKKTLEWLYIHFDGIRPLEIEKELVSNAKDFLELISYIYKPSSSKREDESLSLDQLKFRAKHAKKVIDKIRLIPGQNEDGEIDSEGLKNWILDAQQMLEELDRVAIGNQEIGQLLSKSPNGKDGVWPHESVREVFEECLNDNIKIGFIIGKQNQRGIIWRQEGGQQEYALAKQYRDDAKKIRFIYPNTFQILTALADSYEEDGRREDLRDEL